MFTIILCFSFFFGKLIVSMVCFALFFFVIYHGLIFRKRGNGQRREERRKIFTHTHTHTHSKNFHRRCGQYRARYKRKRKTTTTRTTTNKRLPIYTGVCVRFLFLPFFGLMKIITTTIATTRRRIWIYLISVCMNLSCVYNVSN